MAIIQSQISANESTHAHLAIEIAKREKIFSNRIRDDEWTIETLSSKTFNATGDDFRKLEEWRAQLATDTRSINEAPTNPYSANGGEGTGAQVISISDMNSISAASVEQIPTGSSGVLSPANVPELNRDQLRAYEIIVGQLRQTIAGNKPPVLHMIICGEGGTGKSKVLQTMTKTF